MQEKRFGSFVIRYWLLPRGQRRLEIEHIQSGERHRCASLQEAEDWLAARVSDRVRRGTGPPDGAGEAPGRDGSAG